LLNLRMENNVLLVQGHRDWPGSLDPLDKSGISN
jgi:hypothetical protein